MRVLKRIGMLALAASLTTAATVGASVTAAHAQLPSPSVTVDTFGTFDAQEGTAKISGTFICGTAEGFVFVEVTLSQPMGSFSIVSGSDRAVTELPFCEPGTTPLFWRATIDPTPGEFRGGLATAHAELVVEPVTGNAETVAETTEPVILKGGPPGA
jgi:hypothetical protein